MKVWSAITIILSIVCISFIIYFAPVEYTSRTLSKMNVQEKIVRYNGSVRAGFEESSVLKRSNLFLHEFFVSTNDESLINSDIEKKDDEEFVRKLANIIGKSIIFIFFIIITFFTGIFIFF